MNPAIPKPQRQKKPRKPLRRSPIKWGRKCHWCRGTGEIHLIVKKEGLPDSSPCIICDGTGRLPPKPIKRKAKPKVTRPTADFDKRALQAIWSSIPDCILSHDRLRVDAHHILGRRCPGASSPYNCIMLSRSIHQSGHRDKPELRSFFLKEARQKVNEAIRDGRYAVTDADSQFLRYSDSFLLYPSFQ